MLLQFPNHKQGHVNAVGPNYYLCESLPIYVQSVAEHVQTCASKALLPLSSCIPAMALLELHTHEHIPYAPLCWGVSTARVVFSGACFLCSCVMPYTGEDINT